MPIWTRDSTSQAPRVVYTPDDPAEAQCDALIYDPQAACPWQIHMSAVNGQSTKSAVEDLMRANGGLLED